MKTALNKILRESSCSDSCRSCVNCRNTHSHARVRLSKILVPVDFSDESKKALEYAVAMARHFGAAVELLHVVEPTVYASDLGYGPVVVQTPHVAELKKARARLSALARKFADEKLRVKSVTLAGSPWFEITQAAKALEIDLIVIGTHGYTGLKHMLLGSTAEKVVRHAPCPVFVARREEHEFIQKGTATG